MAKCKFSDRINRLEDVIDVLKADQELLKKQIETLRMIRQKLEAAQDADSD